MPNLKSMGENFFNLIVISPTMFFDIWCKIYPTSSHATCLSTGGKIKVRIKKKLTYFWTLKRTPFIFEFTKSASIFGKNSKPLKSAIYFSFLLTKILFIWMVQKN